MTKLLQMQQIINGSIEALDQIIDFIKRLDNTSYHQVPTPLFDSSIGQHLRHILDLYQPLLTLNHSQTINYDIRRRGISLETVRNDGLSELQQIKTWLSHLTPNRLVQSLQISTQVSIVNSSPIQCMSSFARELCFASSHLVHHLALMVAIVKYLGQPVDAQLGLAPSTAIFLRNQQKMTANVS